jgi:4-hydroxy-3-methylbut-2-enyl diphosphate reductase
MSEGRVGKPEDVVQVGDELSMKIIKLDADERKIGLSLRAYREARAAAEEDEGDFRRR